jgi:hypothetical protein
MPVMGGEMQREEEEEEQATTRFRRGLRKP